MKRLTTLFSFLLIALLGQTQNILDQYVQTAIAENLSVREKQMTEKQQQYRLQQANAAWGPEVSWQTTYTLAAGGRSIDFPIGTLLNDVYSTLNDLTATQRFPTVENQTVTFLPHNFYDTRLRITQPILQPEIRYGKMIRQEELTMAGLQTNQTKRALSRDVKSTYFRWLQAKEGLQIIDDGLSLLEENKRITESLIRNGVALPSALLRIEAEIIQVQAQRQKAEADVKNAAAYFNFLLHRDKNEPILMDTFPSLPVMPVAMSVTGREELSQIKTGSNIQQLALTLEEKHHAPRLGLQVDVGSQAFAPDWGGYVLGGVSLEVPIWDNKKSQYKRKELESGISAAQTQYAYTLSALQTQLETETAYLVSDLTQYESYAAALTSNQRYFTETTRRYKEGLSNYIEWLDARTQLTQTRLQQSIAKYQAWIRRVQIDYLSATDQIQ